MKQLATGVLASAFAVAVVTAAIELIKPYVPVLSLGVLYVFAVLPIAVAYGLGLALVVSVASMAGGRHGAGPYLPARAAYWCRSREASIRPCSRRRFGSHARRTPFSCLPISSSFRFATTRTRPSATR
jgi:hypothetical protein